MPSRPRSSVALPAICAATLMNTRFAATSSWLSNTCTVRVFSTTYQRALLAGSCSISTGEEKAARLGNTRSTASDTWLDGASPARQVVLAGRESRPATPGAAGGGALEPPPGGAVESPPQACSPASHVAAMTARTPVCRSGDSRQAIGLANHGPRDGSRCARAATSPKKRPVRHRTGRGGIASPWGLELKIHAHHIAASDHVVTAACLYCRTRGGSRSNRLLTLAKTSSAPSPSGISYPMRVSQ